MRISDWSSDVCSSDLRRDQQARAPIPGGNPAFEKAGLHQPPRELLDPSRTGEAEQRQHLFEVADRRPCFPVILPITGLHADDDNEDDGACGLHQQFVEEYVIAIRSEEHTSELQSLMRISYAVF